MLNKAREVDRLNELKKQEMTHNMAQYVEITISPQFVDSMKAF